MSGFEEAVSHSRMQSNTAAPSPATVGSKGSFSGEGGHNPQMAAITSTTRAPEHRKGTIANAWPDGPGGQQNTMTQPGSQDSQSYEPPSHGMQAVNAARGQRGENYPCYPDAAGGDLGMVKG